MSKYFLGVGLGTIVLAIITILFSKVIKQGDEIADIKSNQKRERKIVDKYVQMTEQMAKGNKGIYKEKTEMKEKVDNAKSNVEEGVTTGNDIINSFNRM